MTVLELQERNKPKEEEEEDEDELQFDQSPVQVVCPHCGGRVITFIEHESSWVTYTVSLVLLMILGWSAVCIVPVVWGLLKDVVHHCPRCLSVLATRSRMVLPSFRDEVMSFRFGSCVVVLARKYVILLLGLSCLIGGIHFFRTGGLDVVGVGELGVVNATRTTPLQDTWDDFYKHCSLKTALGNPIHVTSAFNKKYKNHTVRWQGTLLRHQEGLHFLWIKQRSALFVKMSPTQFTKRQDVPDMVLTFESPSKAADGVKTLSKGKDFAFEATLLTVGRRGTPHVAALWEVYPATPNASALGGG